MDISELNYEFQGMDLSLLDQLLKGRFKAGTKVLDAGFGSGRNSFWFINNGFEVYGIDQKQDAINAIKEKLGHLKNNPNQFVQGNLEDVPWEEECFDLIICNAVLHFAKSLEHFHEMFSELIRVLKFNGILFIRMTSDIGFLDPPTNGESGVFRIPDGSHRFLLTRDLLASIMQKHRLKFVEELKTVNVNDLRCMSTLVLTKV